MQINVHKTGKSQGILQDLHFHIVGFFSDPICYYYVWQLRVKCHTALIFNASCYFRLFNKMLSMYFFSILIIIFSTIIIHLCGSDIIPSVPPFHSSPRPVESTAKASLTSTHSGTFFNIMHKCLSISIPILNLLRDFIVS